MYNMPTQNSFWKSGKKVIRRTLILTAGIFAVRNSYNNLFSIPANIIAGMLNKNIENDPLIPTMQPTFEIDKVSLETKSELMNANLRKIVQPNEIINAAVTKKPNAKPISAKLTSAKPNAKPSLAKLTSAKPTRAPTREPTREPTSKPTNTPPTRQPTHRVNRGGRGIRVIASGTMGRVFTIDGGT
jgi:hypothetical protein